MRLLDSRFMCWDYSTDRHLKINKYEWLIVFLKINKQEWLIVSLYVYDNRNV